VEDQPHEDGHEANPSTLATRNEATETRTTSPTRLDVLVLGGLGGRVDQAFSQIHNLYTAALHNQQPSSSSTTTTTTAQGTEEEPQSDIRLYLISEESVSFILLPGPNKILTPGTDRPRSGKASHTPTPTLTTDAELPTTIDGPDPNKNSNNKKDQEEFFLSECVGIIPVAGPAAITTSGLEWDVADWTTVIGGQLSTSNHIRADEVTVSTTQPVLFTVELARRFKIGGRST
jgi:thiamine pyrophosphokinase